MVSPEALHRMTATVTPLPSLMTLVVKLGNQYGQRVIHPADERAMLMADLLQTKTFTARHVDKLKALGYEVRVVQDLPETL